MKNVVKLIAVVLLAALLASACISCKKDKFGAEEIAAMYSNSAPTKIVSRTVQTSGDITVTGTYTLLTGTIGGKAAAIYEEQYQEMRTVEEGGQTTTIYEYIKDVHKLYQYVEGKGTRELHPETKIELSTWNENGKVYTIEQGSFAINLAGKGVVSGESYDAASKTYTATVPASNTATVFGQSIASDVKVRIVNDGAQITEINVEYDLPAEGEVQATHIVISVEYTYDNERINLD